MKKLFLTTVISILTMLSLFAQNEMDALRYSMIQNGGTARFTSMGGAFGALGGDFSVLSLNPAGLGIYRSSEITITPSIGYQSIESSLFGNTDEDLKYNFNLNNIGVVFAIPVGSQTDAGGWKFVNLGFGLNRHNNFNSRWAIEGFNTNNSLMTSFLEQAMQEAGIDNPSDFPSGFNWYENLEPFTTRLAWETLLLDTLDGSIIIDMANDKFDEGKGILQRQTMNTSGSIRELVISIGANYSDIIYLGATIGLPTVSYEQSSTFFEADISEKGQLAPYFNELTYRNRFKTTSTSTGFNIKMGGIVRLGSVVRLGAAIHTPSFFKLEDIYNADMTSNLRFDNQNYEYFSEPEKEGKTKYEINTPLKMIGSLGLVLGTTGLFSVDYEYIDYTKARLRSDDYMFSTENNMIRNTLAAQHSIRAGGEFKLNPLVLRAGYAYYSSPFATGNDGKRNVLSAGFGIRGNSYTLDFAYAYSIYSEDYALYVLENAARSPIVQRDYSASTFMLTLGWRF